MRRLCGYLGATVGVVLILAMAGCGREMISADGFRGLDLGEAAYSDEEYEPTGISRDLLKKYPTVDRQCLDLHYTRKGDSLVLGDIKLQTILYTFYKGRLSRVFMACALKDKACNKVLYDLAIKLLGKPDFDQSKPGFWWASWDFSGGVNIKVQTGSLTIAHLGMLSDRLEHCKRKILFH